MKDKFDRLLEAFEERGVAGRCALEIAKLCHDAGLDSPGQWGNAYFRCPNCSDVRDLNGEEDWDYYSQAGCECWHDFTIEDLVISEGWLERLGVE